MEGTEENADNATIISDEGTEENADERDSIFGLGGESARPSDEQQPCQGWTITATLLRAETA